jgi:hypothetical protein
MKLKFEETLLKVIREFEADTGITVTEIGLIRADAVAYAAPVSKVRTVVDVVTY